MEKRSHFNPEILAELKNQHYGKVFVNLPIHYRGLLISCSCLFIILIFIIIFGDVSQSYLVQGYLNSTKGVTYVYPKKSGVIIESFVRQDDVVKQGDPLLKIDTTNGELTLSKSKIITTLNQKKQTISNAIFNKEQYIKSLQPLINNKYISTINYQQKIDEINTLKRQEKEILIEIIQYKRSLSYTIYSPNSGKITNVLFQPGYYVSIDKPLLQILPTKLHLIAQLYVPVMLSGFINNHDPIVIRYDAYPYQHFGTEKGSVNAISDSILIDEDEIKPIQIKHPYYKVIANIEHQFVRLNGKIRPLKQGMTLTAVLKGPRKKIWQWIFKC